MRFEGICKLCVVCLMSLVLSNCAYWNASEKKEQFQIIRSAVRQAELSKLTIWIINGSLSIQHDQRAEMVHYQWREMGLNQYQIQLISAMGLYTASIEGRLGSVTFWKNVTIVTAAKTPEGLMQKALGWHLPITPLHYWMKGMYAPKKMGNFTAYYDNFGHLIDLQQSGWHIRFSHYATIESVDLPQEISLTRPDFSVKIIIKSWFFPMQKFKANEITS